MINKTLLDDNKVDAFVLLCKAIKLSNVSPLPAQLLGPGDKSRQIQIYTRQYCGLIDAGLACREDRHDRHQPHVTSCIGLSVSSGKQKLQKNGVYKHALHTAHLHSLYNFFV